MHLVGTPIRLCVDGVDIAIGDGRASDLIDGVDALIVEEDTFLVLSAPPEIRAVREHPIRVLTAVLEAEPLPLGSVHARAGEPLLLLAVVDAVEHDPPGSLAAVEEAWRAAFEELRRRKLRRVGTELLGAIHGGLDAGAVAHVLRSVLRGLAPGDLEALAIVTKSADREKVRDELLSPAKFAAD